MIPFALFNALTSFQGYISKILRENLDILVIIYLDDILIHTKDLSQDYVEAKRLVLDLLRKNGLFINLKKCWFQKKEVQFLKYIVLSQSIWIENKRIVVVTNWPKPMSLQDIKVFINFTIFYWRFIWGFSRIVILLTSMLKTTGLLESIPWLEANNNEVVQDIGKTDNKNLSKKLKNAKSGI